MEKPIVKSKTHPGWVAVFRYLKPHARELSVLSVLGIISAVANGFVPLITGRLIDSITHPSDAQFGNLTISLVVALLGTWLIAQVVAAILGWILDKRTEVFSTDLFNIYTIESYSHLLRLPLAFHKKTKIGEYTNKLWRTANALETIGGKIVVGLAPQVLTIIVAFIVGFWISPLLSTIMLGGILCYVFLMIISMPPLMSLERRMHDAWNIAFGDAYDAVANVLAVKQATAEEYETRNITNLFAVVAKNLYLKLTHIRKNLNFYQRAVILVTQLLIFIFSIAWIRQGSLTIGDLVMFNAYAAILFGPFVTIAQNWQTVQNGLAALERSDKILFTPEEAYTPEDAVNVREIQGDIQFKNVDFYYDRGKTILKNISFQVKAGEVVALVGESGVGKSTLIDLLSGYHFAKKGRVLIDGHNIRRLPLRMLRSQIAVVPQEVVLFNDTIKTNIKYGNFKASDEQLEIAARQAHALDFIEKFPKQWKQVVGERGIKLSVGQKQRVAIARAILRQPKILILDEPTSALDAKSENIIQQSLEELMRGRTTFIIAHRLSTVRKADKILVFKDGEIVEAGTHAELIALENGTYRHLYELQIGLHT